MAKELRKYEVLSEELEEIVWEDFFSYCGHPEYFRIYEVIEARNHAQAKYLAWKRNRYNFTYDIRDMPKFSVKLYRGEGKNDFGHMGC